MNRRKSVDASRQGRTGVAHDQIVCTCRSQVARTAGAEKLIEGRLDPLLGRVRATVTHPSVLKLSMDMSTLGGFASESGSTPGSVWKFGSLERNERILSFSLSTNGTRKLSSVTTLDTTSGCCLAEYIAVSPPFEWPTSVKWS